VDILEIEDVLKGLPDQALMQEAQQPTGQVPQYMVVSEIQRRSKMRKSFEAQKKQPSTTIAEQILTGGVASVAPPPPQMMGAMGMPQQPPAQPQQPPMGQQQPPMPPQQMPPQQPPMPPPIQMVGGGKTVGGADIEDSIKTVLLDYGIPANDLKRDPKFSQYASLIDQISANMMSGVDVYDAAEQRANIPYGREFDPDSTSTTPGINIGNLSPEELPLTSPLQASAGINLGDLSGEELADLMAVNPVQASSAGVNIGDLPTDDLPLTKSDMGNVITDVNNSNAVIADTEKVLTGNTNLTPDVILSGLSEKSFLDKQVEDQMKGVLGSDYSQLIEKANNLIGNVPAAEEEDTTLDMFSTMPSAQDVARVNVARPELGDLVAPSYGKIIEAQEQRLKKVREDAKRDVGAQALIQLGAGIAAGDVSTGLSEAGKAAAEERKRQRDAEDQITSLQTQIQMAQEQGNFDVAKALRDEQLNLYKMDVDLEKDYLSRSRDAYEYDAALQKGIIEFNKEFGQSVAEFDAELDQAVNEYNLKIDEMGLDVSEEEGLRLRARAKAQQDIVLRILPDPAVSEEEKQAAVDNLKETLQLLKEPFSVSMPSKIPTRQTGSVLDTSGMTVVRD
jgi:hypothetical protein